MRDTCKLMMTLAGTLIALLSACPGDSREVTVAYSGRTIAQVPYQWALKKGYFKEEGLQVKFVFMSTSIAAKGIMSGDVDYTTTMGGPLRAAIAGVPIVGVYSMFKPLMYFMAQPRYGQVNDLRGRVLGISTFGGAYDIVTRLILKHHGLEPDRDATILQIGDSLTLYAALKAGSIDAAILGPPFDIKAELEGYRRLFDAAEIFDMPFEGLATHRQKLQTDRQQIKAMIRAMERARRYLSSHRDEAEGLTRELLDLNIQEAKLSVTNLIKSFRQNGRASDEGVTIFIESALQAIKGKKGSVTRDQIVDWSVVGEVVAELDRMERR